jgi:hypothetical protein
MKSCRQIGTQRRSAAALILVAGVSSTFVGCSGDGVAIRIEPDTIPPAQTNVEYQQQFTISSFDPHCVVPVSFGIEPDPPAGLSLSPEGLLSGAPTQTGSFRFTIRVATKSDVTIRTSAGDCLQSAEKDYTLVVTAGPAISVSVAPPAAAIPAGTQSDTDFVATIANDGADAGVNWALNGASCPSGCGQLNTNPSDQHALTVKYRPPAIAPNPNTVTLTATSVTDPTKAGSAIITITSGPVPASIVASGGSGQSTLAGTAFPSLLRATVKDSANQPLPWLTVVFTAPGSGASGTFANGTTSDAEFTDANGVATSTTFTANRVVGSYTVTATVGVSLSADFNLTNMLGAPAKLAFVAQPSNAAVNATIAPPIQVAIEDVAGNQLTSAANPVTLAIAPNPGGATLSGTTSNVSPASGVSIFADLSIDKAGTGYTLVATSPGLTSATSAPFDVIVATAAAKLRFITQPLLTDAGSAINGAPAVEIDDANGVPVPGASDLVTIQIETDPSGGSLSGTLAVAARNAVATFNDAHVDLAGHGYTLKATATLNGVPASATSDPFDVRPLISSLSPIGSLINGRAFTLVVNGVGFPDSGFFVFWDGQLRATTPVSHTAMHADIPASDLTVEGTHQITVGDAPPSHVTSSSAPFGVARASSPAPPPATVGAPYSAQVLIPSAPIGAGKWTAGLSPGTSLPPSITLGQNTGFLTGTPQPSEAGIYPIFLTIQDELGNSFTQRTLFVVTPGNPCVLDNRYVYLFQGYEMVSGTARTVAAAGMFQLINGDLASGQRDTNRVSGITASEPFVATGGACVMTGPDRGLLTLTTNNGATNYVFTIDPTGNSGRLIEFDRTSSTAGTSGAGILLKQTGVAFGAGNAVFALSGEFIANITSGFPNPVVPTPVPAASIGQLNLHASGNILSGEMDVATIRSGGRGTPTLSGALPLTNTSGLFGARDLTGRGIATLTVPSASNDTGIAGPLSFAYYSVDSRTAMMVELDTRSANLPALGGVLRPQGTVAGGLGGAQPPNTRLVFTQQGTDAFGGGAATVGGLVPEISNVLSGTIETGSASEVLQTGSSYSNVDTQGRVALALQLPAGATTITQNHVVYLTADNSAGTEAGFILTSSGISIGEVKQQSPFGGYSPASLKGSYRGTTVALGVPYVIFDAGRAELDGLGNVPNPRELQLRPRRGQPEQQSTAGPQRRTVVTRTRRGNLPVRHGRKRALHFADGCADSLRLLGDYDGRVRLRAAVLQLQRAERVQEVSVDYLVTGARVDRY